MERTDTADGPSKVMSMREAIAAFVHDGATVCLEGFTHLIPTAAGHEIIRQGRKDLTVVRMTADIVVDQMIAMRLRVEAGVLLRGQLLGGFTR